MNFHVTDIASMNLDKSRILLGFYPWEYRPLNYSKNVFFLLGRLESIWSKTYPPGPKNVHKSNDDVQ